MTAFARGADLRGAEFIGADLRGARFAETDLSGVVMRGVNAGDVDIDDPLLGDGYGNRDSAGHGVEFIFALCAGRFFHRPWGEIPP